VSPRRIECAMPNILAPRHRQVLARFAASNVLVAFDYDGTLAPIVTDPARARMRASTARLLRSVAERYPCAVISGRMRADLVHLVETIPFQHLAGNHGIEPWGESARFASRVRRWVAPLRRRLDGEPGIVIEDKAYSVTLHYRRAPHKRHALWLIHDAVRSLPGARTIDGKDTVNVVTRGAPHKGIALERARTLFACEAAIYIGDDRTDEDAFAAGHPDRLLPIRVGRKRGSRAWYWLESQTAVDAFLRALLRLRSGRA
jgi:trehalose 6-phosphate phosphatase